MKKLVLIAHEALHTKSQMSKAIVELMKENGHFDFIEVYKEYTDHNWNLDVEKHQKKLLEYDEIIILSPVQWYNTTPIMRRYLNDVLTTGYAFNYSEKGEPLPAKLKGKKIRMFTTSFGDEHSYTKNGLNMFSIKELFSWLHSTANYIGMHYLGHENIYGVYGKSPESFREEAKKIVEKLAHH